MVDYAKRLIMRCSPEIVIGTVILIALFYGHPDLHDTLRGALARYGR